MKLQLKYIWHRPTTNKAQYNPETQHLLSSLQYLSSNEMAIAMIPKDLKRLHKILELVERFHCSKNIVLRNFIYNERNKSVVPLRVWFSDRVIQSIFPVDFAYTTGFTVAYTIAFKSVYAISFAVTYAITYTSLLFLLLLMQ